MEAQVKSSQMEAGIASKPESREKRGSCSEYCSSLRKDFLENGNIKLIYLFKTASSIMLYPYLMMHAQSLGLSENAAGISNSLTLATVIAQPLAGLIAEKIGNFKIFLSILTLLTPVPPLLMLLVPAIIESVPVAYPSVSYTCVFNGSNDVPILEFSPWPCSENFTSLNNSSALQVCGFVCSFSEGPDFVVLTHSDCTIGNTYSLHGKNESIAVESVTNFDTTILCPILKENSTTLEWCDYHQGMLHSSDGNFTMIYRSDADVGSWDVDSGEVPYLHNPSANCLQVNPHFNHSGCERRCEVLFDSNTTCTRKPTEEESNYYLVFWTYTVLRVLLAIMSAAVWMIFEGAVLAIIQETHGNYGVQRTPIYLAAMIIPPLSGYMIDYFNDFRPVFYCYAVVQAVSAVLSLYIHIEFRKPPKHLTKLLVKRILQAKVLGLFFAVLASGIGWGFLESFLYWFIGSLGGSKLLMGLTVTVSAAAGFPLLISCKYIVEKLGYVHVLSLGLIFYGLRCWGYSYIVNPWMALTYECGEAVTSGLAVTAVNMYVAKLSCPQTVVALQSIVGALYFTVGRSLGGLIGGFLISIYGHRITFRLIGSAIMICGVIYSSVHATWQFYRKSR